MFSGGLGRLWLALVLAVTCGGCDGCSDSDAEGASGAGVTGANVSGEEREAQDAVLAEVQKRWLKMNDGWVTARDSGTSFAPIKYLRQVRDIAVGSVRVFDLTEADRMNGFEWAGEVSFKPTPVREVGEQGVILEGLVTPMVFRQKGQWSQWIDFEPEAVRVQKLKGAWRVETDTWWLRGTKPTDQDFAGAGVSR